MTSQNLWKDSSTVVNSVEKIHCSMVVVYSENSVTLEMTHFLIYDTHTQLRQNITLPRAGHFVAANKHRVLRSCHGNTLKGFQRK